MRLPNFKLMLLSLMLFLCSSVWAATVWKWVDKSGVTHYSDQPVAGAVQVDLNAQTYDAEEARIPPSATPARPRSSRSATATYQSIEIARPANEETLAGTGGTVAVSVRIAPGLVPGHSLKVFLDGQVVSGPDSTATDLELQDVSRGAHTLSASVVSGDGQTILQSSSITFFLQQPTVLRKKK